MDLTNMHVSVTVNFGPESLKLIQAFIDTLSGAEPSESLSVQTPAAAAQPVKEGRKRRTAAEIAKDEEAAKAQQQAGQTPVIQPRFSGQVPEVQQPGNFGGSVNPLFNNGFGQQLPPAQNGFASMLSAPVQKTVEDIRALGMQKMQADAANGPKLGALLQKYNVNDIQQLAGEALNQFFNEASAI